MKGSKEEDIFLQPSGSLTMSQHRVRDGIRHALGRRVPLPHPCQDKWGSDLFHLDFKLVSKS